MDLLAMMAKSNTHGFLLIGGNPASVEQIARIIGEEISVTRGLLEELEKNGVFSRDEKNVVFSRRMRRDDNNRQSDKTRQARHRALAPVAKEEAKVVKAPVIPTQAEWSAYAKTIGWLVKDADSAFDYYTSNGWKIGGKTIVKDWQACARNCQRRKNVNSPQQPQKKELGDNHRNSCYSPPTYKVAGFSTREDWVTAGCP